MSIVLFAIGIWAGFCTFVAYCCVRVGSMHCDDLDDWHAYEEETAVSKDR